MALLPSDIREIEKKFDIAIYEIRWWDRKSDSANTNKRKTDKGIGFAKWCIEISNYWYRRK